MTDRLIEIVLDESKWLTMAMVCSAVVVGFCARGWIARGRPARVEILAAMNRFYGCMIGVMGTGHLLAVSVKLAQGTLEPSPLPMLALGLGLAIPAWLLVWAADAAVAGSKERKTVVLNGWLGVFVLAVGPHNFPLAAPAVLNIAYRFHRRRAVGWAVVALAVALYGVLLVGSIVFLLSGQSFEQFQGME